MNLEKLIRSSLIIQWVLIALFIIITFIEAINLPPLLEEYVRLKENENQSSVEMIGTILMIISLLIYLISSIGVFNFKKWSRSLYLWSYILGIFAIPFWGITIMTPYSYVIGEVMTLFIGITLAILYFSEVKEHFK